MSLLIGNNESGHVCSKLKITLQISVMVHVGKVLLHKAGYA